MSTGCLSLLVLPLYALVVHSISVPVLLILYCTAVHYLVLLSYTVYVVLHISILKMLRLTLIETFSFLKS